MARHARIDNSSFRSRALPTARLSKVMAVIGANAAGKTNLLKPLSFLADFIAQSFHYKPIDTLWVQPHFFSDSQLSSFDLEFEIGSQLYRYTLSVDPRRVHAETLQTRTSSRYSTVFNRVWLKEKSTYRVVQRRFGLAPSQAEMARGNASLISTAAQFGVPLAVSLSEAFGRLKFNVNNLGLPVTRGWNEVVEASGLYADNEAYRAKMVALLGSWDFGLSDVQFRQRRSKDGDERDRIPVSVHRYGRLNKSRALFLESSGTQEAYVLLSRLLPVLKTGGVAIIDELEAHLHPMMVEQILRQFIDPKENPKNAQIIFTSHSVELLNFLQKQQIILVEKDAQGDSHAWRLSDVKGVRAGDNFFAKYLAGAYGAVPNL